MQFPPRIVISSLEGSLYAGKHAAPSLQQSPAATFHPQPVNMAHTVDAERALFSPDRAQHTPPRPLLSPSILIVGDCIARNVRFFNTVTHCVPDIQKKLQGLLPPSHLPLKE